MAGIFKAYDIRGAVGAPGGLTETKAYWIGRGLAQEVFIRANASKPEKSKLEPSNSENPGAKNPVIVVSRDMRVHSPHLAQAVMSGLCDGGCDVLDIGLAS